MQKIIRDEEQRVRAILGEYIFAIDEQTMESVIIDRLRALDKTVALAEIASGGLVAARLSQTENYTDVLAGSVVATSPHARQHGPRLGE